MNHHWPQLLGLINECALVTTDKPVVLRSGKVSNKYINLRRVALTSNGGWLLAEALLDVIGDYACRDGRPLTVFGCPATAAIPLVQAVLMHRRQSEFSLPLHKDGFYVREAQKEHGLQQLIEGYQPGPDDDVVMLEDVVSTGGSLVRACEAVRATGARVVAAIGVVDRLLGADKIQWGGTAYRSVFTIDDLSW